MTESDGIYLVGYCKPPKHAQFVKGQSGNPKGRPKGSQNVFTVLLKAARQRVSVKTKKGPRTVTKLEATVTQLSNQAASGDPRAIREFLSWLRSAQEANQSVLAPSLLKEEDRPVIENILKRLLRSGNAGSQDHTCVENKNSSEEVDG